MRHVLAMGLALVGIACGGSTPVVAEPERERAPEPEVVPVAEATSRPDAGPPASPAVATSTTLPAPAAPGIDGAPVESLAAWSAGVGADERDVVAIGDGLVVIDAAHFTRVSGDGTTPTLVRDNPIGRASVFADALLSPIAVADGAFLVRGDGGRLAAVDAVTLEVRWTIHRLDLPSNGSDEAHLSSGDTFFVVVHDTVLALDPNDGHVLWESRSAGTVLSGTGRCRAAAGVLVVLEGGELVARDARTGVVRWRQVAARDDRMFDADGDRLPVLRDEQVVIVSLTDGHELADVALRAHPGWGRTVALQGDDLYVLVPTHPDSAGENELRRYALDDRAPRWRSVPLASDATGFHPSLAIDDDAVFACTTSWFGRALDRADGRVRWQGPIATCGAPVPWRPREGAPNVLMLAHWSDEGLARDAPAPPERTVHVTGAITCNGEPASSGLVWIDGQHVRADAAGRFRATTTARREVVVSVEQFERDQEDFCLSERRTFPASDPIDASFDLAPGGREGDAHLI